ncbi:Mevalonate kinase [Scheffersomyces spartinae]|uniref:Mevalonate kinase n=1 Tax=Scheffersomyces spartinae TaxID=45513 RepID=A0A9P7VBZ5_9ASCO|nr:Mevalonate kinase [Scheffersomyces spartinae]KAG7194721.1 Mevalonate kinase [Scheffersomyces spartinae]
MTKLDEERPASFCVSAPGKVIIYGEHAAVFGKPAIAAALSLRAYLQVTPNDDPNTITLDFPDIGLSQSWNRHDLPWEDIKGYIQRSSSDLKPLVTPELIPEITDLLSDALDDIDNRMHYVLCHCFLYLYVHLCSHDTLGMHFTARSTLPIGAGLGSSASTAVCLAASMAYLGGHVERPVTGLNERVRSPHNKHHAIISPADFIDEWSFVGEKCFHGNPSGIDNAVATHGGAVMFQRTVSSINPNVRTNMRNFPPIKLLLTNTKVPRSTAELVGGVGKMNIEFPQVSQAILDAIGHLSNEAYQLMIRPGFAEEELLILQKLVNINHGLLVSMGVSHPTLEQIKVITDTNKIGATKLTGAGGGGCAITLIGSDVSEEKIQATIKQFEVHGFETFETSLGGKGVGLLHESDVSLETRDRVFSPEVFQSLGSRKEIENLAGVDQQVWKFW